MLYDPYSLWGSSTKMGAWEDENLEKRGTAKI